MLNTTKPYCKHLLLEAIEIHKQGNNFIWKERPRGKIPNQDKATYQWYYKYGITSNHPVVTVFTATSKSTTTSSPLKMLSTLVGETSEVARRRRRHRWRAFSSEAWHYHSTREIFETFRPHLCFVSKICRTKDHQIRADSFIVSEGAKKANTPVQPSRLIPRNLKIPAYQVSYRVS